MNKIKIFSVLATLAIIPVLFITGCNKHDEITSSNNIDFNSPAFALIDYTDLTNSIDDATLDTPMAMDETLYDYKFLSMADFRMDNANMMSAMGGGRWMQLFDWGKQLGLAFRGMNLSEDQKTAIRDLLTNYHASLKPLVKQFADANKGIMDSANVKRKAIVDDVKAGKLTRLEAAAKIKTLNEATRTAIENNPASIRIKNAMCTLRSDLIAAIGGKLVGDQITKWNVIVTRFKNPCQ